MAQLSLGEISEPYKGGDGLECYKTGPWTRDKLYYLNRYIQNTSVAMANQRAFPGGLCYIDLFAGPGLCEIEQGSKSEFVPGSPLLAAYAAKPFTKILLCERIERLAETCSTRMKRTPASGIFKMFPGDCNLRVGEIIAEVPERSLSVSLIDPFSLNVSFSTVSQLANAVRTDLLILFADRMDAIRNAEEYYMDNTNSVLDQFLGPNSNWRGGWRQVVAKGGDKAKFLRELYLNQLESIGYKFKDIKEIKANGPIYSLVFASKAKLGLDFWTNATKKGPDGQGSFGFD
jgi:three-Cys-motif partner protein